MATHSVTVKMHCRKKGKLSVEVDRFEVKGKASGDDVSWGCVADAGAGTVNWIRIENPGSAIDWPFLVKPPSPNYVGFPNQPATSGGIDPTYVPSTNPIRYSITVCFTEDSNPTVDRYAYIDPDMVFD